MKVSFNGLFSPCYHLIRDKVFAGLSPLQKKVALVAIAYFGTAAIGYFIYHCCCFKVQKLNKEPEGEHQEKDISVSESEGKKLKRKHTFKRMDHLKAYDKRCSKNSLLDQEDKTKGDKKKESFEFPVDESVAVDEKEISPKLPVSIQEDQFENPDNNYLDAKHWDKFYSLHQAELKKEQNFEFVSQDDESVLLEESESSSPLSEERAENIQEKPMVSEVVDLSHSYS